MIKYFNKFEKIILSVIILICINNLFLDIMIVDAAQYASISLEMLHNNSYLQVKDLQNDYLDKPPLLFWISSLGLGLFGVCNFAYKLGAFLMLLLSLFSVFKFTVLFYNQQIAKNAVLVFGTCQAFFLMTNDVRTDGLLTSCVITSVWLISEYLIKNKTKYLISAAVFTALAMMAKGPIGIISILMPVGLQMLHQKKWDKIFNVSWLLFLVVVCVLLLPMSYGLYTQYDLHPEKIINGKNNQSGLYFYYWLQSFGRITGENLWNNGLPWHFFIGSISWDFFPWILILYGGLLLQLKKLVLFNQKKSPEIITLSGFVLIFIMLSMSTYKLPHYIFVILPFASIICAVYLETLTKTQSRNWEKVFFIFGCIILILLIIYPLYFFKEMNYGLLALLSAQLFLLFRMNKMLIEGISKMIGYVIVLNLFLSFIFYPKLLTFQADSMAGKWFYENKANETVYLVGNKSHSFNFYTKNTSHKAITLIDIDTILKPCWLYIKEKDLLKIETKYQITEKKKFANYSVTQLKLPFLLQDKRPKTLEYNYLINLK